MRPSNPGQGRETTTEGYSPRQKAATAIVEIDEIVMKDRKGISVP